MKNVKYTYIYVVWKSITYKKTAKNIVNYLVNSEICSNFAPAFEKQMCFPFPLIEVYKIKSLFWGSNFFAFLRENKSKGLL